MTNYFTRQAYDSEYITEEVLNELLERTDKISRKTVNLIKTLKTSPNRGIKFD